MTAAPSHRLEGLEPDNLLAFLALLGLLRALETEDCVREDEDRLRPRAAWDVDQPPLRPRLFVSKKISKSEVAERSDLGIRRLLQSHDFGGRKDLTYAGDECRALLEKAASDASRPLRGRVDLLAALMSDAAIKEDKEGTIDPTPLCLIFGQGHQHFLERLANVPQQGEPPPRGKGKKTVSVSAPESLAEALFEPWHRKDPTPSFRWDPDEGVRYALMAGDPTDAKYKTATQHGANRLAAVGLAAITLVPERRAGRVRPNIIGGVSGRGGFSFAWPIWREPATLCAIRALLAHPNLRETGALRHLSVDHVLVAQRFSIERFMNFSRARRRP